MKYEVKFPTASIAKKFQKALEGISHKGVREEITKKVLSLGDNPRPHGEPKIKPPVEVYNYVAQYRLRAGSYRVLYDVDDKRKTVWLFSLRKRDERTY